MDEAWKRPRNRYSAHKASAKQRGIPFLISFDDWWTLWAPFWHLRGKGKDSYVMSRRGDVGPYALGNVAVIPRAVNRSEQPQAKGSRVGGSKLIEADIPRVKDMLAMHVPQRHIALWFGVGQPAIKDINRGITWRHA